jgi:hypothetical protein
MEQIRTAVPAQESSFHPRPAAATIAWPDRRCMTTFGTPWPAGKPDYLGGQVPGAPPSPGRTSPVSYP